MAFFNFMQKSKKRADLKGLSPAFLHSKGCKVCPLNNLADNKHPQMEPSGARHPDIYMLAEYPTPQDDRRGEHFAGGDGELLFKRVPSRYRDRMRFNYVVRTRPPNRSPSPVEIECCRMSVVKDIEESKPKAIFGFGPVVLQWLLPGQSRILNWAGRMIPVRVGTHECWYFPMISPNHVASTRKWEPRDPMGFGSDLEQTFAFHLKFALAKIDELEPPVIDTEEQALEGLTIIDGDNGIEDVEQIEEHLRRACESKLVGFDYETNCLRPFSSGAKLLTAAVAYGKTAMAFPFDHDGCEWAGKHLDRIERAWYDFLMHPHPRKVAHHVAFEQEWSALLWDPEVVHGSKWGCSEAQGWVLDERRGCLSLDFLCLQYFGINLKAISSLNRKELAAAPLKQVLTYNALDARYHLKLYRAQAQRLKVEGLEGVYKHHVTRQPTMVLTAIEGVPIDQDVVREFWNEYSGRLSKVEQEIADTKFAVWFERKHKRKFRPAATQDVNILLKELKIEHTDANEATLAAVQHKVAKLIVRWRKANKILSTYVKPVASLPEHKSEHVFPDGRAHPIININLTRTGRTSCEDPNLQNWPKRNEESKTVRRQVTPARGCKVCSFDFAGIQARNVAMESKDKTLVDAFWHRYDIHSDWMNRTLEYVPNWVPGGVKAIEADDKLRKAYRNKAKNGLVFPSFFGAGKNKVASVMGIEVDIAEQLIKDFWAMFPHIRDWHQRLQRNYNKTGYVTGLSGYRRRAPVSPNELINAPIQADEAAIVCDAMYRLSKLGLQATMEIHDDLTFVWRDEEVEENATTVIREMLKISFDWINVPLQVEVEIGNNWYKQSTGGEFASDTWDGTFKLSDELREKLR